MTKFFNRFATMARYLPAIPVVGAETKFQPVYVGDVAEAVAAAIAGRAKAGATYELGGPEVKSFGALIDFVLRVTERQRHVAKLSFVTGKLVASITSLFTKLSFGLFPRLLRMTAEWLRSDEADARFLVGALQICRRQLETHPDGDALRHMRMPWQLSVLIAEIEALGRHRAALAGNLLPSIERELLRLEQALELPEDPGGRGR